MNFKTIMKYVLLSTFGGYAYVLIEIIFRGRSDVSMMFCASICVIPMMLLNNFFSYEINFLLQIALCTISTTALEWIFGILYNSNHRIWDYSGIFLSSPDGQVCVPFALVWGVISAFVIILMDYIDWQLFGYMPETPPYYKCFGKIIFSMKDGKKGGDQHG